MALVVWLWVLAGDKGSTPRAASAQQQCQTLADPKDVPSPALISFEELPNAAVIGNSYWLSHGVAFENSRTNQAIIYGNEPAEAKSPPNVAINNAIFPNTSSGVPMVMSFDSPKTHVGMWIGNGETLQIAALLSVFDANGGLICQVRYVPVPEPHTVFLGLSDPEGRIMKVTLDYGETSLSESIDDFIFSPGKYAPTRTPLPTWTPVPSPTPTAGPTATPTPVLPMVAYLPPVQIINTFLLAPDYSIHGIEITQGIQCFDTSKGLAGCANNSLPVVTKKDATARIYLKVGPPYTAVNNIPVRLHIFAAGVEYIANATGKATSTINQGNYDSAEIYFNVNFASAVNVDFYAEVDPNNVIAETNEGNNRFPSSGLISLNFQPRKTMKIVGERLHYHPTGYSGTQNAGGWAVNGGAADWFEQVLPMRNNGVNYLVRSGYLDWTKNLGSGDNQHSLIQTLNTWWVLENAFSFWFSGDFTGARHIYGWAPNDGYTGGHADMPIYPHAGGLGVVGIGTDRPGTSTDNPGGGALIFGHELVHDYNVFHTDTADACGSNDDNSDFPYGSSSIQEFGFNPITGKIYDPAATHDLMSYCPAGGSKQGWIAPFTWSKMFTKLVPVTDKPTKGFAPPGLLHLVDATESLVVNATIFNPAFQPPQAAMLGHLYRLPGGVAYSVPQGDYAVELLDASEQVLYSQPFTITFQSEYTAEHTGSHPEQPDEPPPFPPDPTIQADVSFILPWVDGTTTVALTHLGQTIDSRPVSANAPLVEITSPTQQEDWQAGSSHLLTWQGSDADGDTLNYSIFYSYDGGAHWLLLDSDLPGTERTINVDEMAGGSDVRFRVVATDGVNTGFDETDHAISIPNQKPTATILSPENGAIHPPGALVVLQGMGNDMEDGTLAEEALSWSSDVQGGLGSGPSVALNALSPGKHTITLTVTDSFGFSSSASVSITIAHPVYLPAMRR
jgi:hypothetical protein